MKVLQVKEYNQQQEIKYSQKSKEWEPGKGGFPQIAFYLFYTTYGSERQTGYVAFSENRHCAIWRSKKSEAIKEFQKSYGKLS
ncbi:MAG: hypothetical protein WC549_00430 [Actinomycetota bacterium]